MRGVCVGTLLFLILGGGNVASQNISTVVLPSADEAYEALIDGEIDYDQFLVLLEVIEFGDNMDFRAAQNELPNLNDFIPADDSSQFPWAFDQIAPEWQLGPTGPSRGAMKYQYYSTLDQNPADRYGLAFRNDLSDHWAVTLKLRKETNGRERFVGRRISYKSKSGPIRTVDIGNFNAQYGLGMTVGYRTKFLKPSKVLGMESLLFPDAGGFNGIGLNCRFGATEIATLSSINRDTGYSIVSSAGMIRHSVRDWSGAVMVGTNQLVGRANSGELNDLKVGVSVARKTASSDFSVEYCAQVGDRKEFGNGIIEATKRSGTFRIELAGWSYGPRFLDLSSGSKAATIRHVTTIENLGMSLTDKRSGQYGGMIRVKKNLKSGLAMVLETSTGIRRHDSSLVQIRPKLELRMALGWEAVFDCTHARKNIAGSSTANSNTKVRMGVKHVGKSFELGATIGHSTCSRAKDYFSLVMNAKRKLKNGGSIEMWSNLGRLVGSRIDYWYGFVRTSQPIWSGVELGAKLIHIYRRSSTVKHQLAASLDLGVQI